MTASPEDWKILPFEAMAPIPYHATFSTAQFEKLSQGLIPEVMEDKWFVYLDGADLCFHRSWTGEAVYKLSLSPSSKGYVVEQALCSARVLELHGGDYQSELVDFLIHNLLLGGDKPFPRPAGVKEKAPGVFQHSVSGTGYREKITASKSWWKFWP